MSEATAVVHGRWAARPVLGAALRLLALLGPVAIGFAVALLLAAVLPMPATTAGNVGWWVAVLGGSAGAVFATDRVARRLLPLAILLELSLIFPDKAPSRLRAARTASVRDIEQRLARLRSQGVAMQPYDAAETVVTLVGILGLHDKRTRGHSERVRAFTDLLTAELGLDEDARVRLRWAALVHDIGKLAVPAPVLNSSSGLDDEQWELMHRHPDEGVRLLGGLLPWLGEWGDAVGQHHERYDGLGYPRGLAGEEIAYAARIVALADSFEVMTSGRSYKASRSAAWARGELTRCAGTQFDPALVRAFLGISLGRLRWVLGPVTWLAELPFVATADRAGQTVKVASVSALAAAVLGMAALPGGGPMEPLPGATAVAAEGGSGRPGAGAGAGAGGMSGGTGGDLLAGVPGRPGDGADVLRGGFRSAGSLGALATRPGVPGPDRRALAGEGTGPATGSTNGSTAPAGSGDAASGNTGSGNTGSGNTGSGNTGPGNAGSGDAGSGDAGSGDAGSGTAPAQPPAQPAPGAAGPAERPQQEPAALPPAYHLSANGLVERPPTTQTVVPVPVGGVRVFDARIDRAVDLPPRRDLVVFVRFATRQGNAKVTVRLLDCARGGTGCTELSTGLVTQDKAATDAFQAHTIPLTRTGSEQQRLAAGRLLRVEVKVWEPGAKGPAQLALGSSATPSRLRLA